MQSNFTLVRGAHVEVKPHTERRGKTTTQYAEIIVDGKYSHSFSPKSRVSKHLEMMPAEDLAARLSGGSYFFINDGGDQRLVDFRDGGYNGFVHEEQSIAKFMDILGYQERDRLPLHRRRRGSGDDETENAQIILRKQWSTAEITVPGYQAGADFNSELSFTWNPFVKTINSAFDLVRLICTNGMVGLTNFLNTKVPLFNRWEEHLDIASRQIQNKVNSVVLARVQAMPTERASVAQLLLLEQHAFDRLYAPGVKDEGERVRLLTLMNALSPSTHLSGVYKSDVFNNKALAAQLPGHLSNYDVWNISTEMRTHTHPCAKSSDNALDRVSNGILFEDDSNVIASAARYGNPKPSVFSDPEKAFWGQPG